MTKDKGIFQFQPHVSKRYKQTKSVEVDKCNVNDINVKIYHKIYFYNIAATFCMWTSLL